MAIANTFLQELDAEMPTTRRVIERVPTDKGKWKPHEKSFPLAHLTQLVATMPGWLTMITRDTSLDLTPRGSYTYEKTEDLLKVFDGKVREARAVIGAAPDADFQVPWSLKMGERVLMTLPRVVMLRQTINHLVHHRGQLTVYLRLLDVPVPSIYGPTADEKTF